MDGSAVTWELAPTLCCRLPPRVIMTPTPNPHAQLWRLEPSVALRTTLERFKPSQAAGLIHDLALADLVVDPRMDHLAHQRMALPGE